MDQNGRYSTQILQSWKLLAIKDKIYLIGTYIVAEYNHRSKCWRKLPSFQVSDPQWKQIGRPNDEHAAGDYGLYPCGVVAVDGSIYIMGGLIDTSVERYDDENDVWSILSYMTTARGGIGVAAVEKKIYISGGNEEVDGEVRKTKIVECFDTTTNTWIPVASLNQARSHNHLHSFKRCLIAFGGDDLQELDQYSTIANYSSEENVWTMKEGKINKVGCSYAFFMMMKCF